MCPHIFKSQDYKYTACCLFDTVFLTKLNADIIKFSSKQKTKLLIFILYLCGH